ncbi:MAG: rhomboid family intramembrane serine protease, partial [Hyphomicrobiaceae bacterium]|nr:rhomboid family intramembrane serine protease [Hyphomicrobiaceae bacterium]
VTVSIIAACIGVFIWQLSLTGEAAEHMYLSYGTIPSVLFESQELPAEYAVLPAYLTLVTSMFLHAGWLHIGGNMLYLWVFGDNVEDAMGHVRFLFFYLACGVAAALFHSWMLPNSQLPLIGASGAVAGVIAAYLMLHPRVSVWVLAFKVIPLRITAGIVLGFWIALQVVMIILADAGPTAWWAHIGGLIAGGVLIIFLRRPGVPLFDKGVQAA